MFDYIEMRKKETEAFERASTYRKKTIGPLQITTIVLFSASLFSALYCTAHANDSLYKLLPLLPLLYAVVALPLVSSVCIVTKSWTATILNICMFLRFAIMPVLLCNDPCMSISTYILSTESSSRAIGFMIFEMVSLAIGLKLMQMAFKSIRNAGLHASNRLDLDRPGVVYVVYTMIALTILVAIPASREGLSFLVLRAGVGARQGGTASTFANIMRQIAFIGLQFSFVLVVSRCGKEYQKDNNLILYFIALFVALLSTGIIIDERRSAQVYAAFSSIVLLDRVFPDRRNQTQIIILVAASTVIGGLSLYKNFYAFQYNTYADALQNNHFYAGVGKTVDLYLLGPASVGAGLEPYLVEKQGLGTLLYDFARHIIGISFLVKNLGYISAGELYNLFVSGGISSSGVLLPISVEGSTCVGLPFGPLLSLSLFYVAFRLEKNIKQQKSPILLYFLSYIYIRIATSNVSAALSSVLVSSSSVLVIVIVLVFIQNFFFSKDSNESKSVVK